MTSAANTALNIPEVLEHILLHLPCVGILRIQRVSSFWRSTVAGSLSLQTALFRPTKKSASSTWLQDAAAHERSLARAAKTPPWASPTRRIYGFNELHQDGGISFPEVAAAIAGTSRVVIVNPFLCRLCPSPTSPGSTSNSTDLYAPAELFTGSERHHSLRSMLLVQPGAQELSFRMGAAKAWLKAPSGFLTVGHLLDQPAKRRQVLLEFLSPPEYEPSSTMVGESISERSGISFEIGQIVD